MIDPRKIEIAARLDEIQKRVDRLETLEYGTLSFPSGGGLGIVCDQTVTVLTPSVTCPIPPARRHLMAIVAAGVDNISVGNSIIPKIRVTINAIAAGYQYATRQESVFVVGDLEASSLGAGAAFWETIGPSRRQFFSSVYKQQCSWIMVLPDPERMTGVLDSIDGAWIGGNRARSTGPLVLGLGELAALGGGFISTDAAISSITWTAPLGLNFWIGSRFTVYGL